MEALEKVIRACEKCERLVAHRQAVARKPPRRWAGWVYWARGVPGFGDPEARVWVVGLAPAAHGANRTGRMFTGDSSGDWLYRALYETGFANQPTSTHREDGLALKEVFISAVVRCAPPDNRPLAAELAACFPYLEQEWEALRPRLRVVVPLGHVAYQQVQRLLRQKGPPFGHGVEWQPWPGLTVLLSYHPSQQNTRTGRLKWEAWKGIFVRVQALLSQAEGPS
ncbi:MAG: hypothetical protein KatS3mg026_1533 [Bacteroidia bacterium]|nr:MAG: hypothetical protein KatS3mg026_1533 [Bacteroidia bacterium]